MKTSLLLFFISIHMLQGAPGERRTRSAATADVAPCEDIAQLERTLRDQRKQEKQEALRIKHLKTANAHLVAAFFREVPKQTAEDKALINGVILDLYKQTDRQFPIASDTEIATLLDIERASARHEAICCTPFNPATTKAYLVFARKAQLFHTSALRQELGCYAGTLRPWEATWSLKKVSKSVFEQKVLALGEGESEQIRLDAAHWLAQGLADHLCT